MKIYISKSGIIGPCGPCSFINLTGIKGSSKLEKELSELGRLKPFYLSTYGAFLVWGEKFHKNFQVYTTSTKIPKKAFDLIFYYEKTLPILKKKYRKQALGLSKERNKKYANKIQIIKKSLKKLDTLLAENKKVGVSLAENYLNKEIKPVLHWVIAFKKEGENYYFMDSANKKTKGLTILSKKQLLKSLEVNKQLGFSPALIIQKG